MSLTTPNLYIKTYRRIAGNPMAPNKPFWQVGYTFQGTSDGKHSVSERIEGIQGVERWHSLECLEVVENADE